MRNLMYRLLQRSFHRIWLVSGLSVALILLVGCVVTTPEVPATGPNYGIYWFGKDDANQLAVLNEPNPYYDPTHPTIVFAHGWKPDQGYTHRTMLWQFEDQDSGDMVTLDLAASWIDAGWNVGVFDWGAFADEPFVFDAEAKIWTTEGGAGMRWRDEAGDYHAQRGPAVSAGELFYDAYIHALDDFSGPELRLAGHSLGNQMAARLLQQLAEAVDNGEISDDLMPQRLALLDPYWSPLEQDYLAGDNTGTLVREILEQGVLSQGILIEWYRSSSLTDGKLISDANEDLQTEVVFSELRPRYCGQTDQVCKHDAAWQNYFLSFSSPSPPECEKSDSGSDCIATGRVTASASTSNERLTEMMTEPYHWIQIIGPDGIDNTLTHQTEDDWFERQSK